jgi:hypothetical protein
MVPVRAGAGADGGRAGVGVLRLRREGAGRMSYDVWVEVDAGGPEPIVVRDLNYTSNAWPLFGEVLGRSIRDLDGAPCSEVGGPLTAAVARIRANAEEYRPLVLGCGSWGTPENAADFLEEIAQLCTMAPRGVLRVMA